MTRAHVTKPLAKPPRVVIYVRISKDPLDKRYGVEDQQTRCRVEAERRGWVVVNVFEDNDESATKERHPPQYRKMIAFLEAGLADIILVDVVDRFGSGRLMWKFAEFMRWREKQGIRLVSCEGDDTDTADGQFMLTIKVGMAEREWRKMKERLAKNQRRRAQLGQANGGHLPYYVNHPEAAQWVRDAARDVLDNRSLHSIARDWNAKGRRTEQGNLWIPQVIRTMLIRPSVIGKRELDGELYDVPWEPVLDHTTWTNVRAILTAPDRKAHEVNQRRYPLSGLVYCAVLLPDDRVCGQVMSSSGPKVQASFECSAAGKGCGKNKIRMAPLEKYVTEAMFFALDTGRFRKAMAARSTATDDTANELRLAIGNDRQALVTLEDEKDDGLIDDASYRRRRARITARLDDNETKLSALPRTRAGLPPTDELRAEWTTRHSDPVMLAAWQREIVSAVVDRIDVGPHPRGVGVWAPRRSGESLETWHARADAHRMDVMDRRTDIKWFA